MSIVPSRIHGVRTYTLGNKKALITRDMIDGKVRAGFIHFFRKSNDTLHCACSKMAIPEISTVLREISFFVCVMLRLHCTHMFVPLSIINR